MNYQQIFPVPSLQKYVRYFWLLENDSPDFSQQTFKIISDGLPGLIFQENPMAFYDHDNKRLPRLFLYGQTTKYNNTEAKERFRNIGVYFQPTALKSIFGLDAHHLTDKHIDINDLVKTNIAEQLSNQNSYEKRIELLSAFFIQQINRQKAADEKINFATSQLQKGVSLKDIQKALKISERSLARYFKQHVGISPKLYTRINRFQATLQHLRNGAPGRLTDIAYQSDYFDQSHFIREFKEFAGTNPRHFILRANEQVSNFVEWKL